MTSGLAPPAIAAPTGVSPRYSWYLTPPSEDDSKILCGAAPGQYTSPPVTACAPGGASGTTVTLPIISLWQPPARFSPTAVYMPAADVTPKSRPELEPTAEVPVSTLFLYKSY